MSDNKYGVIRYVNPRKCEVYFLEVDENSNVINNNSLCYTWDVCRIYHNVSSKYYILVFSRDNPDTDSKYYVCEVALNITEIPNKDKMYEIDPYKDFYQCHGFNDKMGMTSCNQELVDEVINLKE